RPGRGPGGTGRTTARGPPPAARRRPARRPEPSGTTPRIPLGRPRCHARPARRRARLISAVPPGRGSRIRLAGDLAFPLHEGSVVDGPDVVRPAGRTAWAVVRAVESFFEADPAPLDAGGSVVEVGQSVVIGLASGDDRGHGRT